MRAMEKDPARASRAPRSSSRRWRPRAARRPRPDRARADAGRAVGRGGRARLALVALAARAAGRRRARRRRVLPVLRQPRRRPEPASARTPARPPTSCTGRGLEVDFVNQESDDVPRDEVISQDPEAGTSVREGSHVTVTVSGGKGTVAVPAVEGQSQEDAQKALRDAGFKTSVKEDVLGLRARGRGHLHLARGRHAGDQGPHGHADRLARVGGHRRAEGRRRSSARTPRHQLKAAGLTATSPSRSRRSRPGRSWSRTRRRGRASTRAPRSSSPSPRRDPRCPT